MEKFFDFVRVRCFFFFTVLIFLYTPVILHARGQEEIKGEIINVNYDLQVAFTDIGNQYLKVGEIVVVEKNNNVFVYLEVLQTSKAVSKLGLGTVVKADYHSTPSDFTGVNIGDVVRKIDERFMEQEHFQTGLSSSTHMDEPEMLRVELERKLKEIEELEAENQLLRQEAAQTASEQKKCYSQELQSREEIQQLENKMLLLKRKLESIKSMVTLGDHSLEK